MTDQTLTAPEPGPVALRLSAATGDLQVVIGGDRTRATLELTGGYTADEPATGDPAEWTVQLKAPATTTGSTGRTIIFNGPLHVSGNLNVDGLSDSASTAPAPRAVARLPRGSSVYADTTDASLTVIGQAWHLAFTSVSGDMRADAAALAVARTSSGDVHLDEGDQVRIDTGSGQVRIGKVIGNVTASTSSGGLRVDALCGAGDLRTVSGHIRCEVPAPGVLTALSKSGDVTVRAPLPLIEAGRLIVDARSSSGRVRTPGHRSG